MNTRKHKYGAISTVNNGNGYSVQFWNPIQRQREYLGTYRTYEEAEDVLNNMNFSFFSENSWMLPRCISVNRRDCKFVFSINIRNKTIRHSASKSLDEIMQIKHDFLMSLID